MVVIGHAEGCSGGSVCGAVECDGGRAMIMGRAGGGIAVEQNCWKGNRLENLGSLELKHSDSLCISFRGHCGCSGCS